jgi:hypothetical protein
MPSPTPWSVRTSEDGHCYIVDAAGRQILTISVKWDDIMNAEQLTVAISRDDAELITNSVNRLHSPNRPLVAK